MGASRAAGEELREEGRMNGLALVTTGLSQTVRMGDRSCWRAGAPLRHGLPPAGRQLADRQLMGSAVANVPVV